ncbi:MAG: hypothetical protein AB4911_03100 [Oscillochloridaceae bacterium umkhey_bin13]
MTAAELTRDVQYITDHNQTVTAVVIAPDLWSKLLTALKDAELSEMVQLLNERMSVGPLSLNLLEAEFAEKAF